MNVRLGYPPNMSLTASQLRADVYRILDRVLASGEPLEIERGGQVLRLVPPRPRSWVDQLPRREGVVVGDPDDLVGIDWSSEWKPDPL